MKRKIPIQIQGIIIGVLVMAGCMAFDTLYPANISRTQPASAAAPSSDKYDGDCTGNETAGRCADKPFDHSNCQYPDRTTNPVDGCDNTDPCDPANVKGGSGDCSDAAPIVTTPPAAVSSCEGK